MKKKTLFLLIIAILVILVGCDNKNNEFAITIQGPDNIETSYSIDYTAYIGDEKLSNDEVLWTISNKDTATLYKNQITGVNKGTIILSVVLKSDGTKVGTKIINVIDPLVTSLRIVGETKVNAGEEILLNVVVSPSDSKEVVKWSVDDPTLATLSSEETDNNSGVLLKGVSGGYVKVTATSASICTSFTVLVKGNVQEIKMYNSTNLAIGQVEKLEFNIDDAV
ncbi:MAG: Ig-like domain-containing protein, partial [Bacilli bacterium]